MNKKIPFYRYPYLFKLYGKNIIKIINKVASAGKYIMQDELKNFEKNFAKFTGANYCVGVSNATDGLQMLLMAAGLRKGDEVLVSMHTMIATASAIHFAGAKPVLLDIREEDYLIDEKKIKEKITSKTKAIIITQLNGRVANMSKIIEISKKYKLKIFEDSAQGLGAFYKNKHAGTFGYGGCFSFYPGKNLGAFGDGGAIVTNSEPLAVRCRMIANHGRIAKYDHKFEGRNSRLDGLQAAILTVKLRHLDKWTDNRIMIANEYLERLKDIPEITLPIRQDWAKQAYHLFVIRHSNRDKIQAVLKESGIQTGIHYPIALPKLEAYKGHGQENESGFSWESDHLLLSLPIGEHLSIQDDINTVVNSITGGQR